MTSPHMPPRRAREPKTPRQTHTDGPRSDEQPTSAPSDRPTSNEPSNTRLRNLAESHAHEAHRLAESRAGLTHALLALAYATLAGQEPPR